jgi:hypothetical protein
LGTSLSPSSRKQSEMPVLNGVTSDNGILADTAKDHGPCLNSKERRDAPVRYPGATLQSFTSLASEAGDISSQAGHYADPVCAPGHWCFARMSERRRANLRRERNPELISRCGRAGDGDGTGYWDVAQNHTRVAQVSRQVTKPEPSPSRVPMTSVSFPRVPSEAMEMLAEDG